MLTQTYAEPIQNLCGIYADRVPWYNQNPGTCVNLCLTSYCLGVM